MWRCPRRVSTVVCVHEPRCQPPDCSGHGTCVEGHCQCTGRFWRGAACDELDCGPANCSQHGLCTESECWLCGRQLQPGCPALTAPARPGPHLAFSVLSWQLAAAAKLDGQGPTAVKVIAPRPASSLAPRGALGRGDPGSCKPQLPSSPPPGPLVSSLLSHAFAPRVNHHVSILRLLQQESTDSGWTQSFIPSQSWRAALHLSRAALTLKGLGEGPPCLFQLLVAPASLGLWLPQPSL